MRSKSQVFSKVLIAALQLDQKFGHQRWTMVQLAKTSGVSRPLIYHYFGKSKIGILEEGVRLIADEIAFSEERVKMWKRGDLESAYLGTRRFMARFPGLDAFYFAHRGEATQLGETIGAMEREFFRKLKTFFPKAAQARLEALFGLAIALTFAPRVGDEAVTELVGAMKRLGGA
jgi:AcrR family transcriptional regulator